MKNDTTNFKKDMTDNFICFFRSKKDGTLNFCMGIGFKMPTDLAMARIAYAMSEVFDPSSCKNENEILDVVGDLLQENKIQELEMVLRLHFPHRFDNYKPFQVPQKK